MIEQHGSEIDPAAFDPRNEELYQTYLANTDIRHQEALALIGPETPEQRLAVPLLAPGEDLLTTQLEERALAYYGFMTSALYRRSIPSLSPDVKAPASMRMADAPYAVLTRGFGSPRMLNPRLVALPVEQNFPKSQLESAEIQRSNMACVGLEVDMKYGGVSLTATVLGRMLVRESTGRGYYAVSNTFSRAPETTKKLQATKAQSKKRALPDFASEKTDPDDDWSEW